MTTRFSLRQMEYCVAVGVCGSIAAASEHIFVSPSSISAAVTHIECELGAQLFVRHHAQGLSVTPIGRHVLQEMRQILDTVYGLYGMAANAQSSIRGPLRIGCLSSLAALVVPELCQGFSRDHSEVQLTTIEDHQAGLLDKLRHAEIDVAITYDLQIDGGDVDFEKLASLPPCVQVSELDPLAKFRVVSLEQLAERPMVLLDLPISTEYFMALFHKVGLVPRIAARSKSPDVVRSLVANDFGYTLVNARPRSPMALDGRMVVMLRLAGEHRPMQLGLAMHRGRKITRVVEEFIQRCRTHISNEYIPGMTPAPGNDYVQESVERSHK